MEHRRRARPSAGKGWTGIDLPPVRHSRKRRRIMILHDHTFGQDTVRPGERRTQWVIVLTAVTMAVEIAAGLAYGSMALLADGLHMASHAVALAIAAAAYWCARRYARDRRFSFGTGKVNALGGFTGAVLLAMFALLMAGESVRRFVNPVSIAFTQAIIVAVIGLIVNGVSVWILGDDGHEHPHGHGEHDHVHGEHGHAHHGDDHNLRSAYFHVMADALTSILAIAALLAGKFFGWTFLDPAMGIVGSLLVARWSVGLLRSSGRVLLDVQAGSDVLDEVTRVIEADGTSRLIDAHVWSIGPGFYAGALVIASPRVESPDAYRARIPSDLRILHLTIEVQVGGKS